MWEQISNPLNNIYLSAFAAAIPIIFLFVLFLMRKIPGFLACILALISALSIAIFVFNMPPILALASALYGILSGVFPIAWIVINAVFLYNISKKTGSFSIVKNSIEMITPDRRLQALLIAFCFGAFLEGAAGFGAPVAITAGMLVGLGFVPLYAAGLCLISNTAPVAFGGVGIAVITAGHLTDIDPNVVSRMISHQLPFIAFIMPWWLVGIMSGRRGIKGVWPAILVTGTSYALTMFLVAHFIGPTLPDVLSAVVSIFSLIIFLRFWQPKETWRFPHERENLDYKNIKHKYSIKMLIKAWAPFILLILFIGNWGLGGFQSILSKVNLVIPFEVLNNNLVVNEKLVNVNYNFGWLSATGTAILFAAIIAAFLLGMSFKDFLKTAKETFIELFKPLITISAIVGFAYVLNFSGMAAAIGTALTLSGHFFPFISPLLGWLGVFITGSDTSSNALFSNIQANTATSLGISPVLTVASNSSGGVAAKMISPQSIAVAIAAVGLVNQEGRLFRFTIKHSLFLILIICSIAYIQAYYAQWMIPDLVKISTETVKKGFGAIDLGFLIGSFIIIIIVASIAIRTKLIKEEKSVSNEKKIVE